MISANSRLPEIKVIEICRDVLNGLSFLHEKIGIIHRDIKSKPNVPRAKTTS